MIALSDAYFTEVLRSIKKVTADATAASPRQHSTHWYEFAPPENVPSVNPKKNMMASNNLSKMLILGSARSINGSPSKKKHGTPQLTSVLAKAFIL